MAVMTDRQFFFVVGVALVSAVVVVYYGRKLGPSVGAALEDAAREVRNTASTIAHAPLQWTNPPGLDSSTVGTAGWVRNKINKVKRLFSSDDETPYTGPLDNGGKIVSFESVPVFNEPYTPYRREY